MIISIDGPAGSGKSTVADLLANKLGFIHFNSGSLYRAVTAHLIANNFDFSKINQLDCSTLNLSIKFIDNIQNVFVNGINYTSVLRNNDISNLSPIVSTQPEIRKLIDDCQRKFGLDHNLVVDGRDIGSHVFPNAEIKFYLDCDLKIRAKRRFDEEKQKGSSVTLLEIEKQMEKRDITDKTKKIAPLVVPDQAIILDSSYLTIDQVVDKMYNIIKTY